MKYKLTAKKKGTRTELVLTESENKNIIESIYHSCVLNNTRKLYIESWTFDTNFKTNK